MRSYRKTLVIAAIVGLMTAAISYIITPSIPTSCRDLREKAQQLVYNGSGLASVFATMPEDLVDKAIDGYYGNYTEQQCTGLLPEISKGMDALAHTAWASSMPQAGDAATAAVLACRDKRVSGELKTHEESAQCSAPGVTAAFTAIHYPYMDLVAKFNDMRLEEAKKLDKSLLPGSENQQEFAKLAVEIADEERKRVTKAAKP